ncbi:MAG: accessory factor UbiK family protein [Gammaproteobacteria bacterium]
MLKNDFFDDLAHRLTNSLPSAFTELRSDAEKTFRNILQQTFTKLDLVTREEFDVQAEVLAQTRIKLDKLLQQVADLEKQLQGNAEK